MCIRDRVSTQSTGQIWRNHGDTTVFKHMSTRSRVSVILLGISLALGAQGVDTQADEISSFFATGKVVLQERPPAVAPVNSSSVPEEATERAENTTKGTDATRREEVLEPKVPDARQLALRRLIRENPGKRIGMDGIGFYVHQGEAGEISESERRLLSEAARDEEEVHVSSIHPSSGPIEGRVVTIVGDTFIAGWFENTDCRCQFGSSVSDSRTVVINSTHISCRAPRLSLSTHDVSLFITSTATELPAEGVNFTTFPSLLVADRAGNQVLRFNALTGEFCDVYVAPKSGGLEKPCGMAFGRSKHLLVASEGTSSVLQYHGATGAYLKKFCTVRGPRSMVVHNGCLFVVSAHNDAVYMFNALTGGSKGVFITQASGMHSPWGVLFDEDTSEAYVSSPETNRIHRYTPSAGARLGTASQSSVWSDMDVPHVQGIALTADSLYAVGPYPGQAFSRFNRTTGQHLHTFMDEDLSAPVDIREFKDYVYIVSNDQVRKYNRLNGEFIRVHAHFPQALGSSLLFHQDWSDPDPARRGGVG
eukprot:TRINITY_DN51817_c0_g1_i1.p1 TRINITY_DN51817_c0_g1~~TRINITY_DN51817_c0_g1_i1.p1  ORF type:complete len:534 (-),score=74.92 TRINITY_DN51817_c0_g1_i1:163-1764(-)